MIKVKGIGGGGVKVEDGTATAGDVRTGKTFYAGIDKQKKTGTILDLGAQIITPGTADQIIAPGQYLAGAQTILGDANLLAANILAGKSIFGVAGSVTGKGLLQYAGGVTEGFVRDGEPITITGLAFTPVAAVVYSEYKRGASVLTSATTALSCAIFGDDRKVASGAASTYFGPGWFQVVALGSDVAWASNNTWYAIGF